MVLKSHVKNKNNATLLSKITHLEEKGKFLVLITRLDSWIDKNLDKLFEK